ncbi:MAG: hypothetical protein ACRCVT_11030 [Leadbetterella sp.]
MNQLILADSSKRISQNFEKTDIQYKGGHISVYFKFSKIRNNRIQLNDKELKHWSYKKIKEKKMDMLYDGEIQFEYGERFYHLNRVILNSSSKH